MDCGHELALGVADDSGMTCDAAGCAGSEVEAGEPLLGCRECNVDHCLACAGTAAAWDRRETLLWTEAHAAAARGDGVAMGGAPDTLGWTPLHWACWAASGSGLRKALEAAGADELGRRDAVGQTPLAILCRKGAAEDVEAALKGVKAVELLGQADAYGRTCVAQACASSAQVRALEAVLGAFHAGDGALEAVLDRLDNGGFAPLHQAALQANEPSVSALLKAGAKPDALSRDGYSALVMVASSDATPERRLAVARRLLDAGAAPNAGASDENDNMTALLLAVAEGDEPLARLLLERGADPAATNASGHGAFHLAVQSRTDCDWPGAGGEGEGARPKPVAALCELLRAHSAPVALATADDGVTPLHAAAEAGCAQAVEALLGADPRPPVDARTTEGGYTALHLACKAGNEGAVRAILAREANVAATDKAGYTPLHTAVRHAGPDAEKGIVEALLAAGASATAETADERLTPLHLAALLCSKETCVRLLDAGGAVGALDRDKDTPLHNAAGKQQNGEDRAPVVQLLLERGAALEAANGKGFTPLAVAAAAGNREVARILVERGAKHVTLRVSDDGTGALAHLPGVSQGTKRAAAGSSSSSSSSGGGGGGGGGSGGDSKRPRQES